VTKPLPETFRSAIVTLVCVAIIAAASMALDAFQAHASNTDLLEVDRKSRERDAALQRKLDDHLKEMRLERLRQAEFRGAVATKLQIKLEEE
jgi:hypothetical protein